MLSQTGLFGLFCNASGATGSVELSRLLELTRRSSADKRLRAKTGARIVHGCGRLW